MPMIRAESLVEWIDGILRSCGIPAAESQIVADHLVDAEARGVVSHGLLRVPQYIQAVADGHVRGGAALQVVTETVATAVLDGQAGFGQVMGRRAMEFAIEKAGQTGVAVVTLVNCGHTGRLGYYTELATRRGMAGMMMVNSGGHGQWVAPYGGTVGRLATNPMSIAVPNGAGDPLVLDIATSVAPEGKVRAMLAAGRSMPTGWVIDHAGSPTTNPADLYGPPRGALLPCGGHKGFGLGMLIDALAGGLSGAGCCSNPNAPLTSKTDGVLVMALDIGVFCSLEMFSEMVSQLIRHVKSAPASAGTAEVMVPGEIEGVERRARLRDGIPVEESTWRMLEEITRKLGVEWNDRA
jgi:hydroxycarboxylate dehydrogenase B